MPLGRGDHRLAQPQGLQRLQGLLDRRRPGDRPSRPQHHRGGRPHHRRGHDPHGAPPREHRGAGRGFRREVPRPHPRAFALAREREAPPRHEDRLHAAARRRRAAGSRVAAPLRLHERDARARAVGGGRQLPHRGVAQPRGA